MLFSEISSEAFDDMIQRHMIDQNTTQASTAAKYIAELWGDFYP